ncbi:MAG: 4Fe-4S binding protein [Bacteroidetes bacterium]|nr:4Fe-4S binding protein [Bacteroidota bacterium]
MQELIQKMLDEQAMLCRDDAVYRQDIEELNGKLSLNWDFCGIKAYQIFQPDGCRGEVGVHLPDADIGVTLIEEESCKQFLRKEPFDVFKRIRTGTDSKQQFGIGYTTGNWIEVNGEIVREVEKIIDVTVREGLRFNFYHLSRVPVFRTFYRFFFDKTFINPMDNGFYIPTNKSLDGGEMATKVFHHFLNKAGNLFRLPNCPCRKYFDSKKHRIDLGCIHLGDGTLNIKKAESRGKYIDAEEAKEVLSFAIEDGLIPLLGRAEGETSGFGVENDGRFLSTCYCGVDACINKYSISDASCGALHQFSRVPDLSLVADREKCIGCGKCMKVCNYRGMKWVDGKPEILDRCLGCGRCEIACPVGAISFVLEDDLANITDKVIAEINRIADVSPQN